MKANKNLLIALAAGVAVAGIVGVLFVTNKDKGLGKKLKKEGEDIAGKVEDILAQAKQKFSSLKKQVAECNNVEAVAEQS